MNTTKTRAFNRMVDRQETYTTIANKLKAEGYDVNAQTVYRYIMEKKVPSKAIKKAIAKVLRCLVSDIF